MLWFPWGVQVRDEKFMAEWCCGGGMVFFFSAEAAAAAGGNQRCDNQMTGLIHDRRLQPPDSLTDAAFIWSIKIGALQIRQSIRCNKLIAGWFFGWVSAWLCVGLETSDQKSVSNVCDKLHCAWKKDLHLILSDTHTTNLTAYYIN